MKKRSHMNFCAYCRKAFEIKNHPDYCEKCRINLDISSYNDEIPILDPREKELAINIYGDDWWKFA